MHGQSPWHIDLAAGIHIPDLIGTEQSLTRKEGESFESFASVARGTGDRGADDVL